MAHRVLVDSIGRAWDVWDVHPEFGERRREAGETPPETDERRRRTQHRVAFAGRWRDGWLAFETKNEKRRLAPIPAGWDRLSDQDVQRLLEAADVIATRGRRRLCE